MKNQRTHIRAVIIMITGVLVLAGTSVWAEVPNDFRKCTDEQKNAGTCLEIFNANETVPVYIIKAVTLEGETIIDADLNDGSWPGEDLATGNAVFTYWAGVSQAYKEGDEGVSKPSAWSYIVFNLGSEPLDAEPPGAQLNLDSVPYCALNEYSADANRIYYKLNPSVNFKGDAIFSLYAPPGTQIDPCNNGRAYVLFGKECSGGQLAVPHVGALPFVQQRRFWCSEKVYIHVKYDQCTGIPHPDILYYNDGVESTVYYEGYTPNDPNAALPPFVYADMPGFPDPVLDSNTYGMEYRDFQVTNWGPAYGTLLCTDSDPVFVWRDRAYFCEPPPAE